MRIGWDKSNMSIWFQMCMNVNAEYAPSIIHLDRRLKNSPKNDQDTWSWKKLVSVCLLKTCRTEVRSYSIEATAFVPELDTVHSWRNRVEFCPINPRLISQVHTVDEFWRWKSIVRFFTDFLLFPIFAVTSSCLFLLLFEYSILKVLAVDLQGVQTWRLSAPLRRRRIFRTSVVHVGTGHVRIRLLDNIGSYWIMLKTSDIQLAVWLPKIDYCRITVLHPFCISACSSLSFWEPFPRAHSA